MHVAPFKKVIFFLNLLFISKAYSNNICPIDIKNLPSCEKGSGLVSEHLPSQLVMLPNRIKSSDVQKILNAIDGTNVKLSSGSFYHLKKNMPDSPEVQALLRRLEKDHSAEIPADLETIGTYARDGLIFQYNSQKKSITVFQKNRMTPDTMLPNKFCGLDVQLSKIPSGDDFPSYGGNLMIFPGGLCVYGKKMRSETSQKLCGNVPKVAIDTAYTAMDHVDEIVNVIPDSRRAPPCDFSIIRSSSNKFIKTLGNNFDQPFFRNLDEIRTAEKNNLCAETGRCYRVTEFCDLYRDYKYLEQVQKLVPSNTAPKEQPKATRTVAGSIEVDPSTLSPEAREQYESEALAKKAQKKSCGVKRLMTKKSTPKFINLIPSFEYLIAKA